MGIITNLKQTNDNKLVSSKCKAKMQKEKFNMFRKRHIIVLVSSVLKEKTPLSGVSDANQIGRHAFTPY